MPFCNHCSRGIQGVDFPEGGPCPGCASLGHVGSAFECPACGNDPGPDGKRRTAKKAPKGKARRTPRLDRAKKAMGRGERNKPCNKPAKKNPQRAKATARQKFAVLTDVLRKIAVREFESCSITELREFHTALIEAANVTHHAIIDRFQRT